MSPVPLKYAIPLLLVAVVTVWILGASKYDFLTAKPIPAGQLRPDFASPVDRSIADELAARAAAKAAEDTPAPPRIEMVGLQTAPELDAYLEDAQQGGAALLDLAGRLQKAGQIQRAVLAYERALDSTPVADSARTEAELSLTNLKVTLPRWNPDPATATPMAINLLSARPPESLQGTVATLTELIAVGSGGLCQPSFQVLTSPQPSIELPALPIAMWLTIDGEDPEKPSLVVVTVAPKNESELTNQITRGLFLLLSRRIEAIAELSLPLPLDPIQDAESAVVDRITRLAWKQILTTPFQSLEEGPPAESDGEEESAEEDTAEPEE